MSRRQGVTTARGFKPGVAADLLGISAETLRYWRHGLDPVPQRAYFSSGCLLAYRLLTVLIRHHFVPVEVLSRCTLAALFETCEHVELSVLERSWLLIDPAAGRVQWHAQRPLLPDDNFDALVQPLTAIVAAHRAALERVGCAHPLRHDLYPARRSPGNPR